MIPRPRQPRNSRMKLLASGLCTATIADAKIRFVNGRRTIEVRLEGGKWMNPIILLPMTTFVQTWNMLFPEYQRSFPGEIHVDEAHELMQAIKGRGCVIRVQHHTRTGDHDFWSHEVMEVYP